MLKDKITEFYVEMSDFYLHYVCKHLDDLFIELINYERFNARRETILLPLVIYLKVRGLGKSTIGWLFGFKLHFDSQ